MSDGFNIDALLENLNYEEISELSSTLENFNKVDERNIDQEQQSKWLERITKNATRLTPAPPSQLLKSKPTKAIESSLLPSQTDDVLLSKSKKTTRAERRNRKTKSMVQPTIQPKIESMDPMDQALLGLSTEEINSLTVLAFGEQGENIFREMDASKYKRSVLPNKRITQVERSVFDLSKHGIVTSERDLSTLLSRAPHDVEHIKINNMGITDNLMKPVEELIMKCSNLVSFSIENNQLSGKSIISLIKIIIDNNVSEVFINNQRNILGSDTEQKMADLIKKSCLVRFGYGWRFRGPQLQAEKQLLSNKHERTNK